MRFSQMDKKRFFTFVKHWPTLDKNWTSELHNLDVFFKGNAEIKPQEIAGVRLVPCILVPLQRVFGLFAAP